MFKKMQKIAAGFTGLEKTDPKPMEVPVQFRQSETLEQRMARILRSSELRAAAQRAGYETFEEADDFEVGEDYDPSSPYESDFDLAAVQEVDAGVRQAPTHSRSVQDIVDEHKKIKREMKKREYAEEEDPAPRKRTAKKPDGDADAQ